MTRPSRRPRTIGRVGRHAKEGQAPGPGKVRMAEFTLAGTPYQALNGGPHYVLSEAVSISVLTEDQAETDRLWEALLADGGSEDRCGWLKDRFRLSRQIVPGRMIELLNGKGATRIWPALMDMGTIDTAALEAAVQPN